jgi:hypothetical protein
MVVMVTLQCGELDFLSDVDANANNTNNATDFVDGYIIAGLIQARRMTTIPWVLSLSDHSWLLVLLAAALYAEEERNHD